jgi:hypothetical protein
VCGDLDFGEKSVNTKRRIPVNAKNKRCRRINSHTDGSIASNFSGEAIKNVMKIYV